MNAEEVINFLLPQWGDPIQAIFFAVVSLMMVYAIGGAHYAARPSEWEKKWTRNTETTEDDFDIEHGSITDLWHAVATAHEKLAEIMPSLLLVVGLLGTFLGLGIALNHASNILGQQDTVSASAAANSMGELMGLLKGLGTKFKTSTWGICGFVLLKIWSELTRFEEKRLAWVIDKVKEKLNEHREKQDEVDAEKQKALFHVISSAAQAIENSIASSTQINQKLLSHGVSELKKSLDTIYESSNKNHESIESVKGEITKQTIEINTGTSDIKSSIESNLVALSHGVSELKKSLDAIHESSNKTSAAMADFTESTSSIVQGMADSAGKMAVGAEQVSVAASGLNGAVGDFSSQFKKVLNQVKSDLSEVLDKVGKDLDSAVQSMSEKSSKTMREGSEKMQDGIEKLKGATNKISESLAILSGDIKSTLAEVQSSINSSAKSQEENTKQFRDMAHNLNCNVAASEENFEKISIEITKSLETVSNSTSNLRSVGRALERQTPIMNGIVEMLNKNNIVVEAPAQESQDEV